MNFSRRSEHYLSHFGLPPRRPLMVSTLRGVERVVVIPALAERDSLFKTLTSIAGNPTAELARTLVVCVVNNHPRPFTAEEDIRNNQETLLLLQSLQSRQARFPERRQGEAELAMLAQSGLRLGIVDASSPGREIPAGEGGVGTARKIGMDAALQVLTGNGDDGHGVILCLDADTLVGENYLSAVSRHFSAVSDTAAVIAYAHQVPADPAHQMAICAYEIFLRGYVLGLGLAGSPYAFHAIGSTMACTTQGYTSVRGMNRRGAAEDFHFLNKLAKVGTIGTIVETTVYPSARISHRVPFGTGRQMLRSLADPESGCQIHHPEIFMILKRWLAMMTADPHRDAGEIVGAADRIHRGLAAFLRQNGFAESWGRIRDNAREGGQLRRQFHGWFDGLRTLRLIHALADRDFPPVETRAGIQGLLVQAPPANPDGSLSLAGTDGLQGWLGLLTQLRIRFPWT